MRAVAFTDLAGNPVGGISQIDTGPGLSGGPITGIGTIEVDFAAFDGNYARLDAENSFSEPQHSPRFEAFNSDPDGVAIEGTGAGSGFSIGVRGATFSSDGGGIWGDAAAAGPGGAVGVLGTTSGEGGSAIEGYAGSPTGSANGIRGVVESPDAVAGAFQNNGDGTVLSAASASWGEVFRVGGEGRVGVVTGFTPDPGDQIFVVDVLATATSGHVRGVNSTTFSAESAAVVGSSKPTIGGTGGSFDTYGEGGTGVWAGAQATTGGGRALVAQNWSPDGISGSFQNLGDGQILSGNNSNAEVFRVEGDGTVRAAAFTDLVGDPIGGISQIDTGAGLSGGPITDIGTIEVDFGVFDNQYARLHTANVFDEDNLFLGNVSVTQASAPGASVMGVVNATDGAIGLQAEATGPGSRALVAFGDIGLQAGGGSVGVSGFTYEPDSIGVAADALNSSGNGIGLVAGAASPTGLSAMLTSNGGRLLEGMANQIATGNPETVVAVEADGSIVQNGFGSALQVGNVWNTGTSSFDEVYRVDADGTITATAVIETSSQRFKTNISSLSGALATIQNLRGVSFDWKRDGQHDIGLIAEEVAEVLPEVVASVDGEAQGVNYGRLTALLIEAVKEQQAHIERLEAMIERQLAAR